MSMSCFGFRNRNNQGLLYMLYVFKEYNNFECMIEEM